MIEEQQIPDVEISTYKQGNVLSEAKMTLNNGLEVIVVNKISKQGLEVWIQEPDPDVPKEDWERICIGHTDESMVGKRYVDGEPA